MMGRNAAPVAALGLALLLGVGALVVHARPAPAGAGLQAEDGTASVDMDKLYTSSDLPLVLQQKAVQIGAEAQERLQSFQSVRFLDVKELDEFGILIAKEKPTDAEEARKKALKKISDDRSAEFDTLINKKEADMSPAEKSRRKVLADQRGVLDKILPAIRQDLLEQRDERINAVRREQIAQLRAIVGQVAKEKGIAHVFDNTVMVYTATDLTPLVLKKLVKVK